MKEQYLDALKKEIKHYYKGEPLKTLYFGGGTPSLLSPAEFRELITLFKITKNTEITAELNPEKLTQEYLNDLKTTGVNRLSIGCQTFDNKILKIIGRKHSSRDVEKAVEYAKISGFKNISLDFIYGLPSQTVEGFEKDLNTAKKMDIQHISLYGLKIDEGCYFYNHMPKNLPDEDIQADMYIKAVEALENFQHYEISNFGQPSKHNLNYWDNENYYGFGVAAHGYIENTRYANTNSIKKYLQNPLKHEDEIKLSKQDQLEEEIFLGFRKMDGIDIHKINEKFDIDFETKYADILKKYKNFFVKTKNGYTFNTEGILISNTILADFLQ